MFAPILDASMNVNVPPDSSLDHATWWLVSVTAVLVVVTIFTVYDGWRRGKLQEKRWSYEDSQREEDAKPNAFVELATYESDTLRLVFLVYNLGKHPFLIDKLDVVVPANSTKITLPHFAPQIVMPGNWTPIEFDQNLILNIWGGHTPSEEAYGVIVIKGANGLPQEVKSGWLHVFYPQSANTNRATWRCGPANMPPGTISFEPRVLPGNPLSNMGF